MPANSRWDLIRVLKGSVEGHPFVVDVEMEKRQLYLYSPHTHYGFSSP